MTDPTAYYSRPGPVSLTTSRNVGHQVQLVRSRQTNWSTRPINPHGETVLSTDHLLPPKSEAFRRPLAAKNFSGSTAREFGHLQIVPQGIFLRNWVSASNLALSNLLNHSKSTKFNLSKNSTISLFVDTRHQILSKKILKNPAKMDKKPENGQNTRNFQRIFQNKR